MQQQESHVQHRIMSNMFTVVGLATDRRDGRFDNIIDRLLNYILNNLGHHTTLSWVVPGGLLALQRIER